MSRDIGNGIGRTHARTRVLLLIENLEIRIINAATEELLRELTLNPERDHQPKTKPPNPHNEGSGVSDVLRHHMAETEGFEPSVPLRGLHLSRVVH